MEIIRILNILFLIIFCILGIVVSIKNRQNFVEIIQLKPNKKNTTYFTLMSLIGGLTFLIIFSLNIYFGLIELDSKRNVLLIFKNIPNELSIAIFEEFLLRIFVFIGAISLIRNKIFGLLVSSIIFCLLHNTTEILSLLSYFIAGLMYGIAFLKFKTVWAPIGLHFAWNYFQGSIFGFPVSGQESLSYLVIEVSNSKLWNGGFNGPEDSYIGVIFRILIIILTFLISHKMVKKNSDPNFLVLK